MKSLGFVGKLPTQLRNFCEREKSLYASLTSRHHPAPYTISLTLFMTVMNDLFLEFLVVFATLFAGDGALWLSRAIIKEGLIIMQSVVDD